MNATKLSQYFSESLNANIKLANAVLNFANTCKVSIHKSVIRNFLVYINQPFFDTFRKENEELLANFSKQLGNKLDSSHYKNRSKDIEFPSERLKGKGKIVKLPGSGLGS